MLIEVVKIWVLSFAVFIQIIATTAFDLQIMQFTSLHFIVVSKTVNFILVVSDLEEELRVGLLSCQEAINDILDVGKTSGRSDSLKRLFDLGSAFHFFFHLVLEESTPESLSKEILVHFELVRVLVLGGSLLCNACLSLDSLNSSLKSHFFVMN